MIGETAEIGDDVTLYQGVTLGIYHAQGALACAAPSATPP